MPELRRSPSWRDPRWQRSLTRLTPSQQLVLRNSLKGLLETLEDCRDVQLDAALQAWSPVKWDPPRRQHTYGQWVEYRLGDRENRGRAIICYDEAENAIYLVARTAIHDHTTLRELVAKFTPKRVLRPGTAPPST